MTELKMEHVNEITASRAILAAANHGETTYVTEDGQRIAAIVPSPVAEDADSPSGQYPAVQDYPDQAAGSSVL